MIKKVKLKYPNIKIKNSNALEAFRMIIGKRKKTKIKLKIILRKFKKDIHLLKIKSNIKIFGPQPFLAFKTNKGQYFHDNLDLQTPGREWSYTFDNSTMEVKNIKKISVAANSEYGDSAVSSINL